ncbi:MAG: secretin N-terminal domain-containing protein [Aliidongia sp.]
MLDPSKSKEAATALPSESPLSSPEEASGTRRGPNIRITADQTTNALLIYATPADYAVVESALAKLDIAPLQVLLEAAIAEVDLTKDMNYGIQYSFLSGSKHDVILSNGLSSTLSPTFQGLTTCFHRVAVFQSY